MKYLLLLAALLCGCASQPARETPAAGLFEDQRFQPASGYVGAARIFALSAEMKRYLKEDIQQNMHSKDARHALFDALYRKGALKLDYDAAVTRNAAETFEARMGNCMSLAIMTAALARELGLTVQFQRVLTEDSWSRAGDLYFNSNHVNLVLGRPQRDSRYGYDADQYLVVDFIPTSEQARMRAQPVEEKTIIAMYMNNRAAEFMVDGKLDEAYWWARQAIVADPAFVNAYNTLGVIYRRHGELDAAERALRLALKQAPENTIFLFNLAQTLEQAGRLPEAQSVRALLARIEPYPPFYFYKLGQQAMERQDYAEARRLFLRELERSPYYHEFHFALASAALQLGNYKEADQHMKQALENSTTPGERLLYAGKLDRLRAHEPGAVIRQ